MARAPALHAGGHRFDSDILHREIVRHTIKNDKTFKKNIEILKRRTSLYKSRVRNTLQLVSCTDRGWCLIKTRFDSLFIYG